ncbi:cwf21 domain-containing protein [Dendryphion nanum]|uniref:Cwf21 domain-containing protein n=1 Tax=Dendryphion nanum TaxID=256645 RepID=A0A9P9IM86_9PLEO|nr:cwf21 domain-containing protein [Dendryphion nanum]
MSENVGLSTPRGSGTSGYVQKNRSLLRPRDKTAPYPKDWDQAKHRQRQPDQEILEHEAKREIEVKVFELRDKLEEEGVDEDDIDDQCAALRKKLEDERKAGKGTGSNARNLKSHQVHDLAKAKIEESERLRKALGISADYEEGSHWRKQEERLRESLVKRGEEEEEELRREKKRDNDRRPKDDSD